MDLYGEMMELGRIRGLKSEIGSAAGDHVWVTNSDTINSLIGISLNFFFNFYEHNATYPQI